MKKITDKKTTFLIVMIFTIVTTVIFINTLMNKLEVESDRARELEVFKDALTIVRKNYVEDIQPKDLLRGAIKGMIASLDTDPNSLILGQNKEMQVDTKGIYIRELLESTKTELNND